MHHEIGLAGDLLRMILEAASKQGLMKVKKAKVLVGEFHLAHPDQIRHSFEMISKGTPAEGAVLEIVTSKLKARCSKCGAEFDVAGGACPGCGGTAVEIVSGKELLVERVE